MTTNPTTYWSQSYDFTINPQMWIDFIWQANERGRNIKCFAPFAAILCLIAGKVIYDELKGTNIFCQVFVVLYDALCLFCASYVTTMFFSSKFRFHVFLKSIKPYCFIEDWFAIVPGYDVSAKELLQSNVWTPCRLTVSTYGVQLDRFIGARVCHTRTPWSTLRKAINVDGMIILRPAVTHQIHYYGRLRTSAYGTKDCVLVDRRAVPNPEVFTQWCQTQIDNAHF